MKKVMVLGCVLAVLGGTLVRAAGFEHFVTRRADKLMDGTEEYRFISFNIPNLHYVEDHLPFTETNPWRLPDEFEITDALTAIRQMGGQAARVYTLSVRKADDDPAIPRHVLAPGKFNEEAFRALDKVLEVANETGVRIIIPFVDNWVWWGGIAEYAGFRGKPKEQFWTDPQIIADFKKTIAYVIDRTNTYTGVKYKDDKAVLAWETGNELQCPPAWTHEIADYIKQLDSNHLVVDGFFSSVLRDESIDAPMVDVVTTHHYPRRAQEMIDQVKANRAKSKGKKPYFVGEFGFVETDGVRELLDTVIADGTSGALIWSLRFRSRDGGFYWHSEPFGGDRYKAYHWPGFDSGAAYDERNLLALMRQKAYEIQGVPAPKLAAPQPPHLLLIEDAAAISWRGSAGAASYIVERAPKQDGPWAAVGSDISDAAIPYRPLFSDSKARVGKSYFYRVKAQNTGGISGPSNVVGPVVVRRLTLVDEMRDFSRVHEHEGVALETGSTRNAKEDMDRVKATGQASLVYQVPAPISVCRVYAFLSQDGTSVTFRRSSGGQDFRKLSGRRHDYFSGEGEYGYFRPVLFEARFDGGDSRFVKIELTGAVQISRVEIAYGGS
ncbi:MAG: cellulase family glycosylhydrolase [Phycisphaerales bacterium]|nr:MAG: cellulase family glycosylhydrolase [Phycisphaerales bacterium]